MIASNVPEGVDEVRNLAESDSKLRQLERCGHWKLIANSGGMCAGASGSSPAPAPNARRQPAARAPRRHAKGAAATAVLRRRLGYGG